MNISVKMTKPANANYHGVSVGGWVSLDIEEYLRGVIPSEAYAGYDHMNALKAQAIAARTYALYLANYEPGDLDDTSSAQVYDATYHHDRADQAIEETSGIVLGYSGQYVFAEFCGANDGYTTENLQFPYMVEKYDPWTFASGADPSGHGRGMSQAGMRYAANNGVSYTQILLFYYDNVRICYNYDVSGTLTGSLKDDYDRSEYWNDEDYETAHLDFGTRTLKYVAGNLMTGTDVQNVKTRLRFLGYNPGSTNNVFDTGTEAAVRKFQKYAGPYLGGLTYDGIVGTNTKKALRHPSID